MIQALALRDMVLYRRSWLWTMVVSAVGSAGLAALVAVGVSALAATTTPAQLEEVSSITGSVVAFTLGAGCAVVSATAGLAIRARAREHALWLLLGVPAKRIRAVLHRQMLAVGTAGGLCGAILVHPLTGWMADQWSALGVLPADADPPILPVLFLCPAVGAALCLSGGAPAARRTTRDAESADLRRPHSPTAHVGPVRIIVSTVLVLALLCLPVTTIDAVRGVPGLSDMPVMPGHVLGLAAGMLVLVISLVLAPWTLRITVQGVARLPVPGIAWHLAGRTAILRSATSTTMTFPFALAMSVCGVCLGAGNLVTSEVAVAELTTAFGLVFALCWIGGVANIAVMGRQRSSDSALLSASGARPATVTGTVLLEGLIYASSAFVFALAATTTAVLLTGGAAGMTPWSALAGTPWGLLAVMFLATLVTCLLAVGSSALASGRALTPGHPAALGVPDLNALRPATAMR